MRKIKRYSNNRPFAWWRHFTTMTRILQGFAFLCKLGLLLFKPHLNMKRKTKSRSSKMTPSCKWLIIEPDYDLSESFFDWKNSWPSCQIFKKKGEYKWKTRFLLTRLPFWQRCFLIFIFPFETNYKSLRYPLWWYGLPFNSTLTALKISTLVLILRQSSWSSRQSKFRSRRAILQAITRIASLIYML